MKKLFCSAMFMVSSVLGMQAQTANPADRALWASIATKQSGGDLTTNGTWKNYYGKVLVSWRMLPTDNEITGFDLYRRVGNGSETQLNRKAVYFGGLHYEVTPITATNYQDSPPGMTQDITYRLTYTGSDETLATYTIRRAQLQAGQPYISIPLKDTKDVHAGYDLEYQANDVSVGDLDGDGEF
jgi:rhamnogalacturonan endolyase